MKAIQEERKFDVFYVNKENSPRDYCNSKLSRPHRVQETPPGLIPL